MRYVKIVLAVCCPALILCCCSLSESVYVMCAGCCVKCVELTEIITDITRSYHFISFAVGNCSHQATHSSSVHLSSQQHRTSPASKLNILTCFPNIRKVFRRNPDLVSGGNMCKLSKIPNILTFPWHNIGGGGAQQRSPGRHMSPLHLPSLHYRKVLGMMGCTLPWSLDIDTRRHL